LHRFYFCNNFCVKLHCVLIIFWHSKYSDINPLMGTLNPQSNGPLYSNTVIGTLAVDGWAVTFGTQRRPGRAAAPPSLLIAVLNVTAHPSTVSQKG